MMDFLPEKNKSEAINEYVLRVLVIFLWGLFAEIIILIILFIPSLFYAKFKNMTLNNQLSATMKNYSGKEDDPTKVIKDINLYTRILDGEKTISIPDTVKDIVSTKPSGVKLNTFQITQGQNAILNFSVSGIAKTRDGLTSFDKALKANTKITNVVLPVSSLIKNSDLDFTITFSYTQ